MTIKNKMISACLMCLVVFSVVGCSPEDGEVISKRKISFINKAIEILEDALDKK